MKSASRRPSLIGLICILYVAVFSLGVFAQDLDNVTISGKITDSNNAPVIGATVAATLATTGIERTVVTNGEGFYRIVKLEPGNYTVKFSANGFGTKEQTNLNTIAGQNVQLNVALTPADVRAEQTITINDDAATIDTTRTVVGGTVTQREIEELPNNSRNPLDLIFTLGGVTEEPLSTRDLARDRGLRGESSVSIQAATPEEAGSFALSGGAAYSNNITIDGLDNNDDRAATVRFTPSLDAISEVQVITNQFSAEYGRASGGRVNFRTRTGGKKFRGRVSYFFEDESLNANTWRNNSRGIARPSRQENIPVFSFGGPVPLGYFKNKTFFFAAYEYQNIKENTIVDTFVPAAANSRLALPASNISGASPICETATPTSGSSAGVSPCVGRTGASPIAVTANFLAPYLEGVPTPLKNHTLSARLDHNFTDTHNVTFNFQYGKRQDFRQFSGGSRLAEALIGNSRDTRGFSLTDNFVFNAKTVNQVRFQYSTLTPQVVSDTDLTSPVVLIGLPTFLDRGSTLTAGSSTSGSSDRKEKRFQFQDTLNYIAGAHSLKFGVDFQRVNSLYIDRSDATGTFSFGSGTFNNVGYSAVQNFLLNQVTRYRHNFNASSTQQNNYYGVFAQDEWRVKPNFTLSYGARYENESIVNDKNNFAPRVGVAWSPFKNNKGVVRFGAGMFYNRALLRTIDDFTLTTNSLIFDTNNFGTASSASRQSILSTISQKFPNPLTSDEARQLCSSFSVSCGNTAFGRILDPNLQLPESYQFNIGFEREIGGGFVVEANYTYNKTARLWREFNPNAISLNILNQRTGGNFKNFAEYLVSRDFDNRPVSGTRPFLGGATTTSANFIRFITTPFNPNAAGAINTVITNPDLGGVICINGAAACSNTTSTPNANRFYLLNLNSVNATNTSSPVAAALAILNQFRPDPARGQLEQLASIGNSQYNGLVVELRRRYKKLGYGFGSSLRVAYTLSSLMDDGVVNTSDAQINGDFQNEWSRSLLDRRHRLAISGVFDTPYWFGKLRFSPILRIASSAPFNLGNGGVDRNLDDVNNDRPNFTGSYDTLVYREPDSEIPQDLINSLSYPSIGASGGNLERNAGRGPMLFLFDLNVSRDFKLTERFRLRPNVEIGNVFNARVFSYGSGFIDANAPLDTFLVPTRTLRPREIRLGLRFDF